jgi:hypothetical protein
LKHLISLENPQVVRNELRIRRITVHKALLPHWPQLNPIFEVLKSLPNIDDLWSLSRDFSLRIGRGICRACPFDTLPTHKANRELLSPSPATLVPFITPRRESPPPNHSTSPNIRHLPQTISSIYFGLSAFRNPCHCRFAQPLLSELVETYSKRFRRYI